MDISEITIRTIEMIPQQVTFSPKKLNVQWQSIASDDSGRSDDGEMWVDFIVEKLYKLDIELAPASCSDISSILSKVQGKKYYLTFFDPLTNRTKQIHCYTPSSKASCYSGVLHNGIYEGAAFSAIDTGM